MNSKTYCTLSGKEFWERKFRCLFYPQLFLLMLEQCLPAYSINHVLLVLNVKLWVLLSMVQQFFFLAKSSIQCRIALWNILLNKRSVSRGTREMMKKSKQRERDFSGAKTFCQNKIVNIRHEYTVGGVAWVGGSNAMSPLFNPWYKHIQGLVPL